MIVPFVEGGTMGSENIGRMILGGIVAGVVAAPASWAAQKGWPHLYYTGTPKRHRT